MNENLIFTKRCQNKISKFHNAIEDDVTYYNVFDYNDDFSTVYFMISTGIYKIYAILTFDEDVFDFEQRRKITTLLYYHDYDLYDLITCVLTEQDLEINKHLVMLGAEITDEMILELCSLCNVLGAYSREFLYFLVKKENIDIASFMKI